MRINNLVAIFANRRMLVTLLQGFAAGLPLALIGSSLQAWYAASGVDIVTIGALSLISQPYVYKFLWSPFLDRYLPPFLGRRLGWILLAQLGLVAVLVVMASLNPQLTPMGLALLALLAAFFSASQDIGIDAYRTELLPAKERGLGAAFYTTSYRIAMLTSGGAALIIADYVGWHTTYLLMAGLMAAQVLVTFWAPDVEVKNTPQNLRQAIIEPIHEFLSRQRALVILAFIVFYKLGEAFLLSLGSKFLLDVGFSLTEIGAVYKGVGLVATLCGTFIGGALMLRLSIYQALLYFGLLQAGSNLLFMWLALTGKNILFLVLAVFGENFCGGLATIALLAYLMSLCDTRYTATQFALLSSVTMLGRTYIGPFAGLVATYLGVEAQHSHWAIFYFWSFLAALPGLALLWWIWSRTVVEEGIE